MNLGEVLSLFIYRSRTYRKIGVPRRHSLGSYRVFGKMHDHKCPSKYFLGVRQYSRILGMFILEVQLKKD